jgi:hypothetical protein
MTTGVPTSARRPMVPADTTYASGTNLFGDDSYTKPGSRGDDFGWRSCGPERISASSMPTASKTNFDGGVLSTVSITGGYVAGRRAPIRLPGQTAIYSAAVTRSMADLRRGQSRLHLESSETGLARRSGRSFPLAHRYRHQHLRSGLVRRRCPNLYLQWRRPSVQQLLQRGRGRSIGEHHRDAYGDDRRNGPGELRHEHGPRTA